MLNMHSTEDLTTRARIRDAAITRVATDGFQVSLRAIAAQAAVSPALIVHQFGSRDGLLQQCWTHVLEVIEREKSKSLDGEPLTMLAQLAAVESYAPLVGFTLRHLQQGGAAARQIFDDLRARTEAYLETGVRAGTVAPSRDPRGRAQLLCYQSVGLMLMALQSDDGELDLDTLGARLRSVSEAVLIPALELYTEPLLRDRTMLEAALEAASATDSPTPQE